MLSTGEAEGSGEDAVMTHLGAFMTPQRALRGVDDIWMTVEMRTLSLNGKPTGSRQS